MSHRWIAFSVLVAAFGLRQAAFAAEEAPAPVVAQAAAGLVGVYQSESFTLHIAEIPCADDVCLYVEMTEAGKELRPIRQQVWALHDGADSGVTATVFAFPEPILDRFMPTLADMVVGMWAAPEHFPRLDLDQLPPMGGAAVHVSEGGVTLANSAPLTLHRDAVRQARLSVEVNGGLTWKDEWLDANGEVIESIDRVFERAEFTTPVTITPEGLVMIDLRIGRGGELAAGDSALVEFAVYRSNGQLVDSTRLPNRKSELLQPAPGDLFTGFGQGVMGMRAPTAAPPEHEVHIRRLVTPPVLAFGERGRAPIVPPDETLVVTIELVTRRPPPRN